MCPFVIVNPARIDPFVIQTQRTASGPKPCLLVDAMPEMNVDSGPFTLATRIALSMATRLLSDPSMILPPVSYTPLVTQTVPPVEATSMASWITVAAVAQFV